MDAGAVQQQVRTIQQGSNIFVMSKANHRATREYASGRGMKSSGQFLNGGTPSHIDQPIPLCCVIGKGGIYRRHPLVRTQVGDRFTLAGSAIEGPAMITARSEEHTSELQQRMPNSYPVLCWQNKKTH